MVGGWKRVFAIIHVAIICIYRNRFCNRVGTRHPGNDNIGVSIIVLPLLDLSTFLQQFIEVAEGLFEKLSLYKLYVCSFSLCFNEMEMIFRLNEFLVHIALRIQWFGFFLISRFSLDESLLFCSCRRYVATSPSFITCRVSIK